MGDRSASPLTLLAVVALTLLLALLPQGSSGTSRAVLAEPAGRGPAAQVVPAAATGRHSRRLGQSVQAVDRCGELLDVTEEEKNGCIACDALQRQKTNSCRVWVDRIALSFPRGSTDPPSDEQRQVALAALAASPPSRGCCDAVATALQARCGCNRVFQYVRETTAMDEPTLAVEYLAGSNSILGEACGQPHPTCT